MSRPAFPLATWRPSRDEYFEALAPAGGPLWRRYCAGEFIDAAERPQEI